MGLLYHWVILLFWSSYLFDYVSTLFGHFEFCQLDFHLSIIIFSLFLSFHLTFYADINRGPIPGNADALLLPLLPRHAPVFGGRRHDRPVCSVRPAPRKKRGLDTIPTLRCQPLSQQMPPILTVHPEGCQPKVCRRRLQKYPPISMPRCTAPHPRPS